MHGISSQSGMRERMPPYLVLLLSVVFLLAGQGAGKVVRKVKVSHCVHARA